MLIAANVCAARFQWLYTSNRNRIPLIPLYPLQTSAHISTKNSPSLGEEISCLEGFPRIPSVDFLINILQRCRKEEDGPSANRLYSYMQQKNLHGHKALGNYLVSALADCGCLIEAQQVFDTLCEQNVYSYNALILGHIKCGNPQHVLQLHMKMQRNGVQPTTYTYVALLKACSIQRDLEWGRQLQEEIALKGLQKDSFVGNAFVGMFGKCGSLREAQKAFDMLAVQDVVSWSALMEGYSAHGDHDCVLDCFARMQSQHVSPNIITFMCTLKSCGILKAMDSMCKVYSEAVKMGFESDLFLGNTSIDMFCKCDKLIEAKSLFDRLTNRDRVSWNILIAGYIEYGLGKQALALFKSMRLCNLLLDNVAFICGLRACTITGAFRIGQGLHSEIVKRGVEGDLQLGNTLVDMLGKCGLLEDARWVLDKLLNRNVVSWSAMVMSYVQCGFDDEAINCFEKMQLDGLPPDSVVFTCSMKACCNLGAVEKGQVVHNEVIKLGFENDIHTGTTLVDMYGEFGLLAEARVVFDVLPARNLLSWSALIKGYGINHKSQMALQCFQDMQEEGIKPDVVAYTSLLVACSHTSFTSEGKDYFQLMVEDPEYHSQTIYHFSCILDLLARSGHVSEAERVLDAMQHSPSKEMLRALLSACKFYGEVEMGLKCFKQLTEMDADDASAYAMMIDVYNSAGMYADADNLETFRRLKKLTKTFDSHQLHNVACS
ncbi:hypothetical protein GOP47_0010873 [Adiantum capillus-veneris]|uniref:Pentatricopeptide repeat-containing protein n=1 Tax=Adiantum capillus-veneris TaxID=13818 RepID=A0A9D4UW64_ADICA|nr:hypothetical protein GOP47_0010873 [Adiantum capillus-veneris]